MPIAEYKVAIHYTGEQGTSAEHEVTYHKTAYLAIPDSLNSTLQDSIIELMAKELPYFYYTSGKPQLEGIKIHDEPVQSFDAWGDNISKRVRDNLVDTFEWLENKLELAIVREISKHLDKLDKAVCELADTVQRKQPEKPGKIPEPVPLGVPPVITTAGQIFDELAKIEDEEAAERMRLAYLERRKQELIEQRNQMKNIQKELAIVINDLSNKLLILQEYLNSLGVPPQPLVRNNQQYQATQATYDEELDYPIIHRTDIDRGGKER